MELPWGSLLLASSLNFDLGLSSRPPFRRRALCLRRAGRKRGRGRGYGNMGPRDVPPPGGLARKPPSRCEGCRGERPAAAARRRDDAAAAARREGGPVPEGPLRRPRRRDLGSGTPRRPSDWGVDARLDRRASPSGDRRRLVCWTVGIRGTRRQMPSCGKRVGVSEVAMMRRGRTTSGRAAATRHSDGRDLFDRLNASLQCRLVKPPSDMIRRGWRGGPRGRAA